MTAVRSRYHAVILGAGPAGLAAAHELSNQDVKCMVLDRLDQVGGLCRTLNFDGYLFDVGGHRFLSRSAEVNALWQSVLGSDLLVRDRKSRIFYRGKFYSYPLRPFEAFTKMGPLESAACLASYLKAQVGGSMDSGFESWMVRKFGRRLYRNFFKTYTEKVWGIGGNDLSSDWAEQRIQQLSLRRAILEAFHRNGAVKSLSGRFYYPRLGPGMFCEKLKELCSTSGAVFRLNTDVEEIYHSSGKIETVRVKNADGSTETIEGNSFLSSLPLPVLVRKLKPHAPDAILEAASRLRFRNFVSVNLIYDRAEVFEDNWLYIHSPDIKAGRIQNYKNWSPFMVPDSRKTSLGVEYFVSEGEELWQAAESNWIELATAELEQLGIAPRNLFIKGFAVKVPCAYPVYNRGYRDAVNTLRGYLEGFRNLQSIGRAGLFRYNNSDHAILTGLYGARNVLGELHDLWSVDPDHSRNQLAL